METHSDIKYQSKHDAGHDTPLYQSDAMFGDNSSMRDSEGLSEYDPYLGSTTSSQQDDDESVSEFVSALETLMPPKHCVGNTDLTTLDKLSQRQHMAGLARKVSFDDQIYMSDEDHQEEVPVPTQLRSCLTTFDEPCEVEPEVEMEGEEDSGYEMIYHRENADAEQEEDVEMEGEDEEGEKEEGNAGDRLVEAASQPVSSQQSASQPECEKNDHSAIDDSEPSFFTVTEEPPAPGTSEQGVDTEDFSLPNPPEIPQTAFKIFLEDFKLKYARKIPAKTPKELENIGETIWNEMPPAKREQFAIRASVQQDKYLEKIQEYHLKGTSRPRTAYQIFMTEYLEGEHEKRKRLKSTKLTKRDLFRRGIRKWKRLTKSEKAFYQQQSAFNNYTNNRPQSASEPIPIRRRRH